MTITVAVTDSETGETETLVIADNDYFLCCTGTCYLDSAQMYPNSGTHVLTIKGHRGKLKAQKNPPDQ